MNAESVVQGVNVYLEWDLNNHAQIPSGYQILVREAGGSDSLNYNTTNRSINLERLQPSTDYLVDIRVFNTIGFGPKTRLSIRTQNSGKTNT